MKYATLWFLALTATPAAVLAQTPATRVAYATYAAGLHVADVDAGVGLGSSDYKIVLSYRTIGLTNVFMRGRQDDVVTGGWNGSIPRPSRFIGMGRWRGEDRIARIEYDRGMPVVQELKPVNEEEREPVPAALQQNTIDGVSALAQLVRTVDRTGRCDGAIRTYDGRRAVEIKAVTGGFEMLEPTSRSVFSGRALRCNFTGRLVAGFKIDEDRDKAAKPLNGSAWLAPLRNGQAPLPVRITFETRWMGDMTMYLTSVSDATTIDLARRDQ
jgi:hypothetical protein